MSHLYSPASNHDLPRKSGDVHDLLGKSRCKCCEEEHSDDEAISRQMAESCQHASAAKSGIASPVARNDMKNNYART